MLSREALVLLVGLEVGRHEAHLGALEPEPREVRRDVGREVARSGNAQRPHCGASDLRHRPRMGGRFVGAICLWCALVPAAALAQPGRGSLPIAMADEHDAVQQPGPLLVLQPRIRGHPRRDALRRCRRQQRRGLGIEGLFRHPSDLVAFVALAADHGQPTAFEVHLEVHARQHERIERRRQVPLQ